MRRKSLRVARPRAHDGPYRPRQPFGRRLQANLEVSTVETTSSESPLGVAELRYFDLSWQERPGRSCDAATAMDGVLSFVDPDQSAIEAEKDAKREIAECCVFQSTVDFPSWTSAIQSGLCAGIR
jgi:hypothetical protein